MWGVSATRPPLAPPQALPAEGDSLLYAVPVCAPYSALSARELGAELAAVESASSRRQL